MDDEFDACPEVAPQRTLTAEQLAQLPILTEAEIREALEKGQRDVAAARQFMHHSPVSDLRFRG